MFHTINSIRSGRERFTMEVIDVYGNVLDDEIAFTCGQAAAFKVTVIEAVDLHLDSRGVLNSLVAQMSAVRRVVEVKKMVLDELKEQQLRLPGHHISDIYRAEVLYDRSKRELDDLMHYYSHWNCIPRISITTMSIVVPVQPLPDLSAAASPQAPWTLDSLNPQQRRYSNRT